MVALDLLQYFSGSYEIQSEFLAKRLHKYYGAWLYKDLKTITFELIEMSSSVVFETILFMRGLEGKTGCFVCP